jgi:hypothetical protein
MVKTLATRTQMGLQNHHDTRADQKTTNIAHCLTGDSYDEAEFSVLEVSARCTEFGNLSLATNRIPDSLKNALM